MKGERGVVDIELGTPMKDSRDRIRGTVESFQNGVLRIKTSYGYVVIEDPQKIGQVK